jgi:SAM-dependent methyltransferase
MVRPSLDAYTEPAVHEATSLIIRRYSTNPADVRFEALQGVDLSRMSRVLDLGCGFGFMVDAIAGDLPAEAEIVGIDMHPKNREVFLQRAAGASRTARFICTTLDSRLDFADESFDAVIASYSLYYFPGIIADVARVLRRDGVFLALTHSESLFENLLDAVGFPAEQSDLHSVLHEFSAENGAARLEGHFGVVETRPYRNELVFRSEDLDDYLALLRFKVPSLLPTQGAAQGGAAELLGRARDLLVATGSVTIEKHDAAFVCTRPQCG